MVEGELDGRERWRVVDWCLCYLQICDVFLLSKKMLNDNNEVAFSVPSTVQNFKRVYCEWDVLGADMERTSESYK